VEVEAPSADDAATTAEGGRETLNPGARLVGAKLTRNRAAAEEDATRTRTSISPIVSFSTVKDKVLPTNVGATDCRTFCCEYH
jgi:hypothetical protein